MIKLKGHLELILFDFVKKINFYGLPRNLSSTSLECLLSLTQSYIM